MVVAAYRHTYEQNLETSGRKCKGVEKELLLLEEDVVGIEPQDFLPWPRYSDTRDFTAKLRSTTIGSLYSRNEREIYHDYGREGCNAVHLVEKCQNFL
jgi:hypothetical protein